MIKRAAAVGRTRQRIITATVEAHRELGIQATSWDEIARRAGVGVGTVYRHFRSLDDLLPACGEIVEATMALPTADQIARAFDGVQSSRARIQRLTQLVFGIYERAAPFIHNIHSERQQLPQLEPWHRTIESTLDALVREALGPLGPNREQTEIARALLDLRAWQAFKQRDLTADDIVETVTRLISSTLRSRQGAASAAISDPAPKRVGTTPTHRDSC